MTRVDNNEKGLLSHEETMKFIKEAQKGSEEAKDILVNKNIGLVRSVLKGPPIEVMILKIYSNRMYRAFKGYRNLIKL